MNPFTLFTGRTVTMVVTAIGLAIVGYLTVQRIQLNEARHLAETSGASLAQCVTTAHEQNAKITELHDLAQQQQARAAAAAKRAATLRTNSERHTQHLMAATVPAECPAAIRWGAHQAQTLTEAWK